MASCSTVACATRSRAVVVKGPLLPFTRSLLQFYLDDLFVGEATTGVVFSHNNASACHDTIDFLDQLHRKHQHRFAYVLAAPPPRQGFGYRNSQREAVAHGVALAVRRWRVDYILVQRPDSAFQHADTLSGLTAALQRSAAPLTGGSAWGRIGFCPFQTQLVDSYGLYHLDDHCMFGRSEAVVNYWSSRNPFYRRSEAASTSFPGGRRSHGCPVPGPESENGNLWVQWAASEGVPAPASTLALLRERAFVLNPNAWSYISLRNNPARLSEQRLPLSTRTFGFRTRSPFTTLRQCTERSETFDCSELPLNVSFDPRGTPAWPCSDPDVIGAGKWGSLCAANNNGSEAGGPSKLRAHMEAITAAS